MMGAVVWKHAIEEQKRRKTSVNSGLIQAVDYEHNLLTPFLGHLVTHLSLTIWQGLMVIFFNNHEK